jgi:hypothetical protein
MREIYDPPSLVQSLKESQGKDHSRLLKASKVRRSEQAKGAREPDLVVEGCPFWLELQDARAEAFSPLKKLEQAERDVIDTDSELWPASICHQTGSHEIQVCVRLGTLFAMAADALMIPCVINYEDFKGILRKIRDSDA